ncbi:cyclodeaminase/cyclohydrolase family protein [Microbacterium sp. LRZ72]|uniref:cyclodeaminase/cyclohydrolase family protein n=1 Tax=Microbacterium sp. LRZ72 TaxID=2942481 RepID=UPI0029A047D4|nr:cyclodeaminase/cyclohydrolase family protein [Microbacterium sp. LRZ72]MDX2377671.1 cyclodeaminase/cyclohydrolase family protein [Microbacterium sp. LRZ72]
MSETSDASDGAIGIASWLERLAATAPAPGGGAAAAMTLAIGAAVAEMAAGYAAAESHRTAALSAAADVRARALGAADRDAAASARLVAAYRLPDGDAADAERAGALAEAAGASLAIAAAAASLEPTLRWLAVYGDERLAPDVVVAARTVAAALRAAAATARSSLSALPAGNAAREDGDRAELDAVTLADELDDLAGRVTGTL